MQQSAADYSGLHSIGAAGWHPPVQWLLALRCPLGCMQPDRMQTHID